MVLLIAQVISISVLVEAFGFLFLSGHHGIIVEHHRVRDKHIIVVSVVSCRFSPQSIHDFGGRRNKTNTFAVRCGFI